VKDGLEFVGTSLEVLFAFKSRKQGTNPLSPGSQGAGYLGGTLSR